VFGDVSELFHTERSHVRALKVLDQVFYRPLLELHILPHEQISLLFPNLTKMLEIHSGFNNAMKARRRETPLIGDISDMLLNMVSLVTHYSFYVLDIKKKNHNKGSRLCLSPCWSYPLISWKSCRTTTSSQIPHSVCLPKPHASKPSLRNNLHIEYEYKGIALWCSG
jgi:hypothetical protein